METEVQRRVLQQRQLLRAWANQLRPGQAFRPTSALLSLVEKGVPPLLRQRVWPNLLGNVLKVTPEAFQLYWSRAQASPSGGFSGLPGKEATVRLIDEDLKRTFVPLGFFNRGEPLYDVIRKMLLTYAFYRPDIGYVQGMSFLAGILAVHIWDDYLCFQCLANLLGSEHLYAFYSLKVETEANSHIARVYPALLRSLRLHFQIHKFGPFFVFPSIPPFFSLPFPQANEIRTDLFLFKWLQTLFAQCFPIEVTARLWDSFFLEGTSFLFRAALAILKLLQPSLLKLPVEDCFALLTGSVRMEGVWREEVSSENLFATIQKIKFSEKQQELISSLVENAFFYEEGQREEEEAIAGRKRKRKEGER